MTNTTCPDAFLSPFAIDEAVTRALAEDFGRAGDVTSVATVPAGLAGRAVVAARDAGVKLTTHVRDGDAVTARAVLMTVKGNARGLLGAERTALNFLGHLSGIATATAAFVRLIAGTRARVCCTRKTTPGLRALQKYAVRCGGGFNHRFGLD